MQEFSKSSIKKWGQKMNIFKEMIKIVPEKYIVFHCEDDQPMGEVRISLDLSITISDNFPVFEFDLMCTNKENYKVQILSIKVSNSKGKLSKDQPYHLIRIFIKNIDNLEKCLSDKFRIRVYCNFLLIMRELNQYQNPIILIKLKVLIEKRKQSIKVEELSNNLTENASRAAVLYANPSSYLNALSSTMNTNAKSLAYFSRILINQQKKLPSIQLKQQNLNEFKNQFDKLNQKLILKQKQLKVVENNFQKKKASNYIKKKEQKLCLGLLIMIFFVSMMVGFLLKKLIKSEIWQNVYDYTKNKFQN